VPLRGIMDRACARRPFDPGLDEGIVSTIKQGNEHATDS
jgi:hypothetical protein